MKILFTFFLFLSISAHCMAQVPRESDYYQIVDVPIPQNIVLEVGGMSFMPDGRLGVATRRGEVWLIDDPVMAVTSSPHYQRFAHGLHEPLGLAWHKGAFYTTQRSELTKLLDTDGDAVADHYQTIYSWPLEGNYHEYSYGPLFQKDGTMIVALNLGWVGYGASLSKWRGWALSIDQDGNMSPIATGMRSPAGMGLNVNGDIFYAENQGDWIGSGYITHVEVGDFVGNPAGLRWTNEPNSPLSLKSEDIPDTGNSLFEVAKGIKEFKTPAVWFPHTILGISTSDIVPDTTNGKFGPFTGQLFVGDQGHSKITRVFLEKVQGVYQGAAIPFREGFASGVLRMAWDPEGGMMVGQTSRGWAATGGKPYSLQRVVWTGKIPFEIHTVRAMPDGFAITLTQLADISAIKASSFAVESFTYKYHSNYGSPPINIAEHPVKTTIISEDSLEIRLVLENLREGYIYSISAEGIQSSDGLPLLHPTAFYTLNRLPEGAVTHVEVEEIESDAQSMQSIAPITEITPNVSLSVGTLPNLLFSQNEFNVPPGSRIAFTFNNDDDMLHNLIVVNHADATDEVAMAAMQLGLRGHEMQYVPASDAVIAHTSLLEPGTSETIIFNVPDEPAEYAFVCTFPGHAMTMRGMIRVK